MRLSNTDSIFIDESGDFGLSHKSKRFCVLGYVYCKNPSNLRKKLRRLLKKLHLKDRYPKHLSELKFSLPYTDLIQRGYAVTVLDSDYAIHMPRIRTDSLEIIRDLSDGVFAAILDKQTVRSTTWTSDRIGNFIFAESVIVNILNKLSLENPPIIYYDRGRLSLAKAIDFRSYLVRKDDYFEYKGLKLYRGKVSPPLDVSSVLEPCIWAADLVAGAYYHKYSNNEWSYANIIQTKMIGASERKFW